MQIWDKYIEDFRDQIVIGRKGSEEIEQYILEMLPASRISINFIDDSIWQNFLWTITNSPQGRNSSVVLNMNDVGLFRIEKDVRTATYYSDYADRLCEWIYVLLEKQTGEIQSNCWKLALELYRYRGIEKSEIDKETEQFIVYMSNLKLLNDLV